MNKKDLDRTKETIRLQLGMDLSRMVHSKKFSIDELLDYCAYISAFNTLYKSEEVDTIEKHEIIRQIFYIYNQVFNASLTANQATRIKVKYFQLLQVKQSEVRSLYQEALSRLKNQVSDSIEPILISATKNKNGIDMKSGGSRTSIAILSDAYTAIEEKLDSLSPFTFTELLDGEFTIKVSFAEVNPYESIVEISSNGFSLQEINQVVAIAKKQAFKSSYLRFS